MINEIKTLAKEIYDLHYKYEQFNSPTFSYLNTLETVYVDRESAGEWGEYDVYIGSRFREGGGVINNEGRVEVTIFTTPDQAVKTLHANLKTALAELKASVEPMDKNKLEEQRKKRKADLEAELRELNKLEAQL